ncbi:hypothetical protein [Spirosoma rhododendri]|uniref:Uncharacterized protein n=1 Tax=Spirosoma rhododendri TaxID=2728024 RepID=A0A7L5DTN8_9BACT|nr:hypothetical protein [Spirosoma rhododendri]QJD80982.1 hypothetical protein HH216_23080 [Spirosoma rhododendri]
MPSSQTNSRIYKSLISALSIALAGIALQATPAHAQLLTSGNAVVTVTVVDVLSLVVAVPAVPIAMGTLNDFQNGSSFTAPAQLVASSNRPYDIKVKSDGDLQGQLTATGSSIPISNIVVQAAPTLTATYTSPLNLSAADQVLISNAPGAMAKVYDVKYSTAANNAAFFVKGGAYTATLTYSITAR